MTRIITAKLLTRANFAEFGEVIDTETDSHYPINNGRCERFHALARPEAIGPNGHVLINLFKGTPYEFPLKLSMVERHPFGSQAFVPLSPRPFVVVVCHDSPDGPAEPRAFVTRPGQGVNYPRNLWHGVLTPIGEPQDFVVVDRGGDGSNVEEFHFSHPYEIHLPEGFQS
ncbi:MAG: ureidoglycolate lyase [Aquamicrobium sp.]|jgi:ureidoglycolate lyase|uniref:ureidoglycolate lyase n=1 Tax=Mesorhizobium sp. Pch-S TaxID=2082387 RepID=UPI0010135B3E|nr:ureidoglycolate lyase [Mesorhizobium sp. Pch-S]MBR2689699.1 ureidoglycolate lyase [Aquamicrobium sp.]QAZ42081.1 Ureidoglycolate hydrolase [Mesorhizobium sp. Pch-S]